MLNADAMPVPYPHIFIDQVGEKIILNNLPQRIVSLVPSQTELLHDLGLSDEVIGITGFCIHPVEWFRTKTRVGGTKKVNIEKVKKLNPQLIIANKEENVKEQIEELKKHFPVWVSDIKNLDDALDMIGRVGEMVNKETEAQKIIGQIKFNFKQHQTSNIKYQTVLYLIWRNPYMTTGNDTFIHDMLMRCGFKNVFDYLIRYPVLTVEQVKSAQPHFIFLSSEPYPFKEKHIDELQSLCPSAKIILVNGEYFSWYGSRLLQAPAYFQRMIAALPST